MILDRPIPGAKKGVHYLDPWNANKMGSEVGKKFTIAGWGMSGAIRENGSENHLNDDVIFHRGYNKFEKLSGNVLAYFMDRPGSENAVELEVGTFSGDSGSGALLMDD